LRASDDDIGRHFAGGRARINVPICKLEHPPRDRPAPSNRHRRGSNGVARASRCRWDAAPPEAVHQSTVLCSVVPIRASAAASALISRRKKFQHSAPSRRVCFWKVKQASVFRLAPCPDTFVDDR
jgi:hypothetical protein